MSRDGKAALVVIVTMVAGVLLAAGEWPVQPGGSAGAGGTLPAGTTDTAVLVWDTGTSAWVEEPDLRVGTDGDVIGPDDGTVWAQVLGNTVGNEWRVESTAGTRLFGVDKMANTFIHGTVIPVSGTIVVLGSVSVSADVLSTSTSDVGWTVQNAANQACTTTCTSGAGFGFDTGAGTLVGATDATADVCLCLGAS